MSGDAMDDAPPSSPVETPPPPADSPEGIAPPVYNNTNNHQQHRQQQYQQGGGRNDRRDRGRNRNQRRGRNNRGPRTDQGPRQPMAPIVPDSETMGWYDPSRDGGFIRRAIYSYLSDPQDAYVPPNVARQYNLRRGDQVFATTGRDQRGRNVVAEITQVNGADPSAALPRSR